MSKMTSKSLPLTLALLLFWLATGCQSTLSPQTADIQPVYELNVDLLGKTHALFLDKQGRLKARAELSSDDGTVTLSIDAGITLLDKSERPLSILQVEIDTNPLPLPENALVIGAVYNLKPQHAAIRRALMLTLSYDPSELPEGVREDDVYVAPYDEATGWGRYSYKRVDTERHRVTTQIERLTKYAVLAPLPPPPSQPTTKSSPASDQLFISFGEALANGKPTLAEFGASICIPCKQMKPILEELAGEYKGKLNVVIVEVYEQMELTRQQSIMAIPTQIVFDASGKEITRHMGLWPREEIIAQLKKMGIE